MAAEEILERATPEDRAMMEEVMAGESLSNIAKKHKLPNKMVVTRRLRKYQKVG